MSGEPVNLGWIFRPEQTTGVPDPLGEHAGKVVHAVGRAVDPGGRRELVLADGARVWAYRHEVVPG